ncbi:polyphosphate polymerase domain-containing protein [Rudanella lutea]|uniref:polyphosphate polymerase domain-containing protein n=1 Tax=Rudanella lutea TaxID=451374 RepID=UPI00035FBC98|nr:polyphosphate polymerase domain-containing protein [Rudanella lutea]
MVSTRRHDTPGIGRLDALAYRFEPITLAQMEHVRLMNRTDTKYWLSAPELPVILDALRADYRWLHIDNHPCCSYETMYYDTPDLRLYHDHQAGRPKRYKVRQRWYVESDVAFTEVKHKSHKRRTHKSRIPFGGGFMPDNGAFGTSYRFGLDADSQGFVAGQTAGAIRPLNPSELLPVLWVGYTRLTLVHRVSAERLTLDLNLSFRNHRAETSFSQLVIAEVKQDARQASPFVDLMRDEHRRPGGLSKYCLGMLSLNPDLKHNRFKPRLKQLQPYLSA